MLCRRGDRIRRHHERQDAGRTSERELIPVADKRRDEVAYLYVARSRLPLSLGQY